MMKYARPLLLALLFAPTAVAAAPETFKDLAAFVVVLLNSATGVLIVLGIVVYFYGISTNILKFGEGDAEKFRSYFLWGIIVLFVMVSLWGIVSLLQNTLFGSAQFNPTTGAPQTPEDPYQAPQYLE